MKSSSNQAGESPAFVLDDRQAARLMNVSPRTVWRLRASGEIPHIRIGRRCLIRRVDVEAFLAERVQR
jgi:excisionase family DNA binding protein